MPTEIASDCYMTPPEVLDPTRVLWPKGIGFDGFHDPESTIGAQSVGDCRDGWDAYADDWGPDWLTSLVNGPYSGGNPKLTAKLCARLSRPDREILNLCPAAPGSDYWRKWVWPCANAIAWLGRLSFVAGRDMFDKGGRLIAKAGELVHGNRTEIGLVYSGDDPYRFREVFGKWEVTVLRTEVMKL